MLRTVVSYTTWSVKERQKESVRLLEEQAQISTGRRAGCRKF